MAEKVGKILVVDDNEDILFTIKLLLKQHVEKVVTETNPNEIPVLLRTHEFDIILLDMNFSQDSISGQEGFFWLQKILEIEPQAVVIFITAFGDVARAVKAIKLGATDFILKPWQNEKLLATVFSALKLKKSRNEAQKLKSAPARITPPNEQPFRDFIGCSKPMLHVFDTIKKVATTDASVLILGENGTGKELVARALHRYSNRKENVFVSVDLGSISETLFESELFGHKKGSFTDAKENREGRLKTASKGSVFLDEIGNLSLPLQAKLLTVIEKREIIPVGTNQPVPIDVRLICTTNMPIYQMVKENRFRQDLLYRVNTVEIHLPPLRERGNDIGILADHFFKQITKKYKKKCAGIHPDAMRKLENYSWPGNVRELQHAIERAVILSENNELEASDFWLNHPMKKEEKKIEIESYNIEDVEKNVIQKALEKHNGNISKTAKELGLTRASLYRRLEKHGL
jgi:DNA-binding NtrC family response regulator